MGFVQPLTMNQVGHRPDVSHRPVSQETTYETTLQSGLALRCAQVTVSRKLVSEIDVSLATLKLFMRQSDTTAESAKNTGTRIGYTRVSTVAQTLDQQNEALAAAGVTKVFSDVMSGARDDRPGLAELLAYVREGDTVVVWKL